MGGAKRRFILLGLGLAVLCAGGWFVLLRRSAPKLSFYGLVIDEHGEPVPDATVELSAIRVRIGPDGLGRPVNGASEFFTRQTDRAGRFELRDVPGNNLAVLRLVKPGYEWVFDWAYLTPAMWDNNRFYGYDSTDIRTYVPDASRPAIFPLFRAGSQIAGRPSRGGSDRYRDGRLVRNEPVSPIIPSAGAGAPATREEKDERLLELTLRLTGQKRPHWLPTRPTTRAATVPTAPEGERSP